MLSACVDDCGAARRELEQLAEEAFGIRECGRGPWLIVAPHPDDETIGATWLLTRVQRMHLAYLTDGAPRDPKLWSSDAQGSREAYAALRWRELLSVLELTRVPAEHVLGPWGVDQEASYDLTSLTHWLAQQCERLAPAVMVLPPYEGGHPDHDAAAFAGRAAERLLRRTGKRVPRLLEATSYHRGDGVLSTGTFLERRTPVVERVLTASERALKREMLARHVSQAAVLACFGVDRERFRRAPRYDFTRPPHPGVLHYETLGFAWTGAAWGARAAEALRELSPRTRAGEDAE
jgi:LmbE family N-acetylglucosaminyl deacetylase